MPRPSLYGSERFSSVRGLLLAGVIAGALLLAGCGGSSDEEAAVEEPTAEETTEEFTREPTSEQVSPVLKLQELYKSDYHAGIVPDYLAEDFDTSVVFPEHRHIILEDDIDMTFVIDCDQEFSRAESQWSQACIENGIEP